MCLLQLCYQDLVSKITLEELPTSKVVGRGTLSSTMIDIPLEARDAGGIRIISKRIIIEAETIEAKIETSGAGAIKT